MYPKQAMWYPASTLSPSCLASPLVSGAPRAPSASVERALHIFQLYVFHLGNYTAARSRVFRILVTARRVTPKLGGSADVPHCRSDSAANSWHQNVLSAAFVCRVWGKRTFSPACSLSGSTILPTESMSLVWGKLAQKIDKTCLYH